MRLSLTGRHLDITPALRRLVTTRLEKLERIQLPPEAKTVKIRFPQPRRAGV